MAASGVFLVAGRGVLEAARLRRHLLRDWTLYVRIFTSKARADRWAVGACQNALSRPLPPSLEGHAGCVLWAALPDGERLIDMSDAGAVTTFFKELYESTSVWGVHVRACAAGTAARSTSAGGAVQVARVLDNQRPMEVDVHRTAAPLVVRPPESAARARTPVRAPPRVAWSRRNHYSSKRVAGRSDPSRGALTAVATFPTHTAIPSSLSADAVRVYQQLSNRDGVFVTGPPGAGKTYLLRQVVTSLRAQDVTVAVCASSGVAANMVGGITAHSWAGFVLGHAVLDLPLDHVVDKVIPASAKSRMRATMVLVIDEIGTVSSEFIERLDSVLRAVRSNSGSFGGIKVIFAGDFLQLAPAHGSFAFCSKVWNDVFGNRAVHLRTAWRHLEDPLLMDLLLRMRVGQHTAADLSVLETRRSSAPPTTAVWLTTHTALAAAKNETEMNKLAGPDVVFKAVDAVIAPYLTETQASVLLDDGTDFVRNLSLRVGAVVAVHSNCYARDGVPAGSRGVVTRFFEVGRANYPLVLFDLPAGGQKAVRVLPTLSAVFALDGLSHAASRTQLPLALSWASTIHSVQGWTLPIVAVDLEDAFAPGQVLSALSRTPKLSGIYLVSFDSQQIIVDQTAVAFHEGLVCA